MNARSSGVALAATLLALIVSAQEVERLASKEDAEREMAAWRAARRALSAPASLSAAAWDLRGQRQAEIVVISTVAEPVVIEVEAFAPTGERFPLGQHLVVPTRHLRLDLRELLQPLGEAAPVEGSLRIAYDGDMRTLSAWLVQRRAEQALEIPLQSSWAANSTRWHSFFARRHFAGPPLDAQYFIANHGPTAISYRVGVRDRRGSLAVTLAGSIEPGMRLPLLTGRGARLPHEGSLELEHDGEPASLVVTGYLSGPDHLSALPMLHGDALPSKTYHALRLPMAGSVQGTHALTFWAQNGGSAIRVSLVSNRNGSPIAVRHLDIEPGGIRPILLETLFGGAVPDGTRLVIEGSAPFHVSGFSKGADEQVVDLALFAGSYGHSTGSYPLPSVDSHEVFTTLVNLGVGDTQVVVEIYWRDGAYSHGPITLASGESRRISVDELIRENRPDLLGRTIPQAIDGGLLRWATVGDGNLIARTEARRRDSLDTFGFNCKSCCEQLPYGGIVPGLVEFLPGESVPFQSAYYYSACDGTMGPYPIPPESSVVPPPFSWNGSTVTASSGADADIEFEATVEGRSIMCFGILRRIFGLGRAQICKKLHLDPWSATTPCNHQAGTCLLCNACCWSQYNYKVCIGKDVFVRDSERNTCLGICAEEKCN